MGLPGCVCTVRWRYQSPRIKGHVVKFQQRATGVRRTEVCGPSFILWGLHSRPRSHGEGDRRRGSPLCRCNAAGHFPPCSFTHTFSPFPQSAQSLVSCVSLPHCRCSFPPPPLLFLLLPSFSLLCSSDLWPSATAPPPISESWCLASFSLTFPPLSSGLCVVRGAGLPCNTTALGVGGQESWQEVGEWVAGLLAASYQDYLRSVSGPSWQLEGLEQVMREMLRQGDGVF